MAFYTFASLVASSRLIVAVGIAHHRPHNADEPSSSVAFRPELLGVSSLLRAHYEGCSAPLDLPRSAELVANTTASTELGIAHPLISSVRRILGYKKQSQPAQDGPLGNAPLYQPQERPSDTAAVYASDPTPSGTSMSKPTRKPVLWVHLHNFAGTFVCMEASRQSEFVPSQQGSWPDCLYGNDKCSTVSSDREHCEDRARSSYSFSSIERDLDDADMCEELLHGTMLRDPVSGVRSTLVANAFNKEEVLAILSGTRVGTADHLPCLPSWDSYQHFDNFAIRSLGNAYSRPPRGVQRDDLERAKQALQRMDVLMILEEMPDHLPQLAATFGWNTDAMLPEQKAYGHDCDSIDAVLSDAEKAFFREVNSLDYELYEFARELAASRTSRAREALADGTVLLTR
eukprot:TRINITY_DN1148_c0_g1_i1.p1 TRINITY_DN1148_c0_g1~~TRINITY_DN1148_c0_g1_i1.p1  ORF type:complete len:401 (-),score=28.00 TRINITY_DN1148_c0_g1_i1:38-1240(-)